MFVSRMYPISHFLYSSLKNYAMNDNTLHSTFFVKVVLVFLK